MLNLAVGITEESPDGWGFRLTKDWESMEEWMSWLRLRKILMRYTDWEEPWQRSGTRQLTRFVPLANDKHEADLKRQAFVGDLEAANFSVKEEKKMGRSPYREDIALIKSMISEVLNETRDDYIVRGGSEILVRREDEPKNAWRWETFPKVLYFSPSELVRKPRGPTDLQNYVFKRDGVLYAVDARRFYLMPG